MARRVLRLAAWPLRLVALTFVAIAPPLPLLRAGDGPIGFAPGRRAGEAKAEAAALGAIDNDHARRWLLKLTEEPHVAGTEADRRTAEFVRDRLTEWGWKAEIVEYPVLLNYPRPEATSLAITRPTSQALSLIEAPHRADKDSASGAAWPAFHGYSASGDAEAQVVYAGYGRPEDFEALEKLGVEVAGKVVLVRYGELFRGLKVYNAQKRGAAGVLIYSDPADDGYFKGDVYPDGPFRAPSAVQRGSVQFLSHGPGDPSTPGTASLPGASRLPWDRYSGFPLDATRLPGADGAPAELLKPGSVAEWEGAAGRKRVEALATVPSLPIAYESARPILEALGGPNVPAGWQGGLPFAYHVGPGPVEVRLRVLNEYAIRPIWNVVGRIDGTVEPDRWVIVGNHRDAWTYGAVDPGSGTAATLEMARAIGQAVKAGWEPRRTLLYCSWDGEEYGLLGSTEWAEHHADELSEKATLMLNVDSAVSGPELDLGGIPSLRDLVLDAAGDVDDPRTGKPLAGAWRAKKRAAWAGGPVDLDAGVWDRADGAAGPAATAAPFEPQMGWLGSGSDYTAYVDHLGIPAADVGFSGRYGVYHSVYDDFYWMDRFGDPGFYTHATAARLYALIAMRAAGADVVPITLRPYASALREHADDLRRTAVRLGRAEPPKKLRGAGEGLPALVAAVRAFDAAAARVDALAAELAGRDDAPAEAVGRLNAALTKFERSWLLADGLPGRPWFRHAVYAPGLTTGYAAWPMPGVRQALNDDDPGLFDAQLGALVARIRAATSAMESALAPAVPGPAPGNPPSGASR